MRCLSGNSTFPLLLMQNFLLLLKQKKNPDTHTPISSAYNRLLWSVYSILSVNVIESTPALSAMTCNLKSGLSVARARKMANLTYCEWAFLNKQSTKRQKMPTMRFFDFKHSLFLNVLWAVTGNSISIAEKWQWICIYENSVCTFFFFMHRISTLIVFHSLKLTIRFSRWLFDAAGADEEQHTLEHCINIGTKIIWKIMWQIVRIVRHTARKWDKSIKQTIPNLLRWYGKSQLKLPRKLLGSKLYISVSIVSLMESLRLRLADEYYVKYFPFPCSQSLCSLLARAMRTNDKVQLIKDIQLSVAMFSLGCRKLDFFPTPLC